MLQLSAVDPNTLNLEPVPEFWPNLVTGMLSIFKSTVPMLKIVLKS